MRVIYLGSPDFATLPLAYLLDHCPDVQVVAVVSQAAKLIGRGRNKAPSDPPVASFARARGLSVLQPASAKDPEFLAELRALAPDLMITAAYGQILSKDFLAIPTRGTINIHPSRLPAYRGATPVQSSLLNGDKDTAVSILFTVAKLDAGNLIIQEDFSLDEDETAEEALTRLFAAAGPLVVKALEYLADPSFIGTVQDENLVSHCKKIEKEDGLVKWQEKVSLVYNRYRAFKPWPGLFTFFNGTRVLLEELSRVNLNEIDLLKDADVGSFIYVQSPTPALIVRCLDGYLAIDRLKVEGSASCDAKAFRNRLAPKEQVFRFDGTK